MPTSIPDYPWYGVVEGDEIEQGDIFEACPVFRPPEDLDVRAEQNSLKDTVFKWEDLDLIVLSQSCDLAKDREKVDDVLLVAVWKRSELVQGELAKDEGMENARKGRLPPFHVLAPSNLPDFEREVRVC